MKYVIIILCFLGLLAACSSEKQESLTVNMKYGDVLLDCQSPWDNGNQSWAIDQIQLYMSHFEIMTESGQWQTIDLVDNDFQAKNVALVSLICGQPNTNNLTLAFDSTIESVEKVRFKFGVPFELNHLNPLGQPSPLNVPSMFWVWQTGHKFARIELNNKNGDWLFHLGSTGCSSASAFRAPVQQCRQPNLFTVELPVQNAQLNIDFAYWFYGVLFGDMPSCKSQPDNSTCQVILTNLLNSSVKQGQ